MEHEEHFAVFGSELLEGAIEFACEVVGVGETGAGVGTEFADFQEFRPSRPCGELGSAPIDGDPSQPRTERPIQVEVPDPADRADENLLDDVFRVMAVVE